MKILFVGGPWNGRRAEVPDDANTWRVAVHPEVDFSLYEPSPVDLPDFKVVTYTRRQINHGYTSTFFSLQRT